MTNHVNLETSLGVAGKAHRARTLVELVSEVQRWPRWRERSPEGPRAFGLRRRHSSLIDPAGMRAPRSLSRHKIGAAKLIWLVIDRSKGAL
jgi:hypothetical protein